VRKTLKWSAGLFGLSLALTAAIFSTAPQPVDFSTWHHAAGMNTLGWTNLTLSGVIVCSFILLYQRASWQRRFNFFAPYGRMALTNYIFQALVGTFIMFGWGLGLLGTIPTSILALMAIVLVVLQTWGSKWWLTKYKYGPLEWLWRSGTFLKWQPFKRESPH